MAPCWGPIRTELEGSYKETDTAAITSLAVNGPASPALLPYPGEQRLTSVMANALFDLGGEDGNVAFSAGSGFGHTINPALPGGPLLEDEDHA